jgi:hypothetical protein
MSIGQIVVLTAVVGALVVFAAVLSWGDYQARQLARRIRDQDRKDAAVAAQAAHGPAAASATAQARWRYSAALCLFKSASAARRSMRRVDVRMTSISRSNSLSLAAQFSASS